jgi:hypothetical protein
MLPPALAAVWPWLLAVWLSWPFLASAGLWWWCSRDRLAGVPSAALPRAVMLAMTVSVVSSIGLVSGAVFSATALPACTSWWAWDLQNGAAVEWGNAAGTHDDESAASQKSAARAHRTDNSVVAHQRTSESWAFRWVIDRYNAGPILLLAVMLWSSVLASASAPGAFCFSVGRDGAGLSGRTAGSHDLREAIGLLVLHGAAVLAVASADVLTFWLTTQVGWLAIWWQTSCWGRSDRREAAVRVAGHQWMAGTLCLAGWMGLAANGNVSGLAPASSSQALTFATVAPSESQDRNADVNETTIAARPPLNGQPAPLVERLRWSAARVAGSPGDHSDDTDDGDDTAEPSARWPWLLPLAIGLWMRSGLLPFHGWLVTWASSASCGTVAWGLGYFGLLSLLPLSWGCQRWLPEPVLMAAGGIAACSVGWSGLQMLAQTDLRRFLAWTSVFVVSQAWLTALASPDSTAAAPIEDWLLLALLQGVAVWINHLEAWGQTTDVEAYGGLAKCGSFIGLCGAVLLSGATIVVPGLRLVTNWSVSAVSIDVPGSNRGSAISDQHLSTAPIGSTEPDRLIGTTVVTQADAATPSNAATKSARPPFWWLVLGTLGWLLAGWATVWLQQRLLWGPVRWPESPEMRADNDPASAMGWQSLSGSRSGFAATFRWSHQAIWKSTGATAADSPSTSGFGTTSTGTSGWGDASSTIVLSGSTERWASPRPAMIGALIPGLAALILLCGRHVWLTPFPLRSHTTERAAAVPDDRENTSALASLTSSTSPHNGLRSSLNSVSSRSTIRSPNSSSNSSTSSRSSSPLLQFGRPAP